MAAVQTSFESRQPAMNMMEPSCLSGEDTGELTVPELPYEPFGECPGALPAEGSTPTKQESRMAITDNATATSLPNCGSPRSCRGMGASIDSMATWLNRIKPGYSRFSGAFDEIGIEDSGDVMWLPGGRLARRAPRKT